MLLKKIADHFVHPTIGSILLYVMVFGMLAFSFVVIGVSGFAISEHQAATYREGQEQAFQIAEAGINYYRWHLAHNQTDYQDGTGHAGPYVHSYTDKNGKTIGQFSLTITAPSNGSTVVTIQSTGTVTNQPNSKRTIKARVGFPALTDYAFLTNTVTWIGTGEVTHGKFQSNGGIRYDGTGDAPITSAVATYVCPASMGCSGNPTKAGVWGTGGPTTLWSYPVPAQDFTAVTAKLAQIKTSAQSTGGLYFSSSGVQGWHVLFNSNGTISVAKVNTTNCYAAYDTNGVTHSSSCFDSKTFGSTTTYSMPSNGYMYIDDNVWVDGTINGRVTLGAGTGKSIIINNNLVYAAKDGTDVIGLIADQNILVPRNSPSTLEIDGALLAQNGAVERYDYYNNSRVLSSITVYGSIITNNTWTWSWVDNNNNVTDGYSSTTATYDANLTYSPPGGFPVGSTYNLISWEEVK